MRLKWFAPLVLLLAPPLTGAPVSAPAASVAPHRALGLTGAPNFRDLGGYRTTDGHVVRWGAVYRSNKLSALTPADIARVQQLRIGSLIDLRAADERKAEPDRWRPANVYQSPKDSIGPAMKVIMAHPGNPASVKQGMVDFYDHMPDLYRPEFAAMLHQLAASDQPLLMHCTAGKDRTGVGSAIVLSLLGVPRDSVVDDFMLTQRLLPSQMSGPSKAAGSMSQIPPASMAAVQAADPVYIQTALAAIDRDYGSIDAYVEKGLGVSRAEIATIRARLLVAAP